MAYYVCSRQRLLRLWKMYYMCRFITLNAADFITFVVLLRLRALLHWRALQGKGKTSVCDVL